MFLANPDGTNMCMSRSYFWVSLALSINGDNFTCLRKLLLTSYKVMIKKVYLEDCKMIYSGKSLLLWLFLPSDNKKNYIKPIFSLFITFYPYAGGLSLFLEHFKLVPISGPLHLLFLLPHMTLCTSDFYLIGSFSSIRFQPKDHIPREA